jgi:hypothetical protein
MASAMSLIMGSLTFWFFQANPQYVSDFDPLWVAARALTHGQDPYAAAASRWPWPLYYPLPAVVVLVPLAPFPLTVARAVFAGVSGGVLAYALSSRGWFWLVSFLSGAFIWAACAVQFTMLLTAAAILPGLRPLYAVKPPTGIPLLMLDPKGFRRAVVGMVVLTLVSLLLKPSWPIAWFHAIQYAPHIRAPLQRPFGWLFLLAAFRWREPRARYFLLLSVMPQNLLLHETLPLVALARNPREVTVFILGTLTVIGITLPWKEVLDYPSFAVQSWPYLLGLVYLPMLYFVLRRSEPNLSESSRVQRIA